MSAAALGQRVDRLLYNLRSYSWLADWPLRRPGSAVAIDRPVFLLGMQGGGLTLLSRMLRRHPCVISAAGNARYWTSADEIQNVFGLALPAELTGMRWKAPFHPRLTAPRSWTYAADELLPVYRGRAEQATPATKAILERVIRYCLSRHGGGRAGLRFVDKSQSYTVRVGLLQALLGEYRPHFVLVPRDPYVSVYRAAIGKAGDMLRLQDSIPYEERLEICAQHYFNSVAAARADAERHGVPFLITRFERLLEEPESELRRVCEFAGLAFDPGMLPAAQHKMPLGSRFKDRWYPLRADINQGYEAKTAGLVTTIVNRHAGNLIPWLGYEVRT